MSKRLNLDDPLVWDKWRYLYDSLTHEENIEFGNDIYARYPGQQSYTLSNFASFFEGKQRHKVLEIGGWRGELARDIMDLNPKAIDHWFNIDMCKAAVDDSAFKHPQYTAVFPYKFKWFHEPLIQEFDSCVSAHVIEHLSDADLIMLLWTLHHIPKIIFEAPITMEGQKWDGYQGTHKLEMGWNKINEYMKSYGYAVTQVNEHCFTYSKV